MGFIPPDEYYILMDLPTVAGQLISNPDLSLLGQAGIKTVMYFVNAWEDTEPEPGRVDWSVIDRYIDRVLTCGMQRVILPAYTAGPTWAPEAWYVRTAAGVATGVLSPWNRAAQEYSNQRLETMVKRYRSYDGQVLVVNTQLTHGETILLNEPAWYGQDALASFRRFTGLNEPCKNTEPTESWLRQSYLEMLLDQQQILIDNPTRTLYTAVHPMIASFPGLYGNGCNLYRDILQSYAAMQAEIIWVLYTWVQWSNLWGEQRQLSQTYPTLQIFGGAEYAEGLPNTAPAAVQAGIRGQFIGPLHPFTNHTQLEPWMLDNLAHAMELWKSNGQTIAR